MRMAEVCSKRGRRLPRNTMPQSEATSAKFSRGMLAITENLEPMKEGTSGGWGSTWLEVASGGPQGHLLRDRRLAPTRPRPGAAKMCTLAGSDGRGRRRATRSAAIGANHEGFLAKINKIRRIFHTRQLDLTSLTNITYHKKMFDLPCLKILSSPESA